MIERLGVVKGRGWMRSEIFRIVVGYSGFIFIIIRLVFCVICVVICDY